MQCPYCELRGHRREIHAHMVAVHADQVSVGFQEERARMFYRVACPSCDYKIEKTVKPRMTDPAFLEEFGREIRLVAFDMLLNHMDVNHGVATEGGPPKDRELS